MPAISVPPAPVGQQQTKSLNGSDVVWVLELGPYAPIGGGSVA
jgi:hypothetical protein